MRNIQNINCIEQYNVDKLGIISYKKYKGLINNLKENQYLIAVLCVSTIVLSIDFYIVKKFIEILNLIIN